MQSENIEMQEYEEDEPFFVDRLKENWKEEAKLEAVEQDKLIDLYEDRVLEEYKRYQDLAQRIEGMLLSRKGILEKIACLEVLS